MDDESEFVTIETEAEDLAEFFEGAEINVTLKYEDICLILSCFQEAGAVAVISTPLEELSTLFDAINSTKEKLTTACQKWLDEQNKFGDFQPVSEEQNGERA